MSQLIFAEGLPPATPATGKVVAYAKTDGKLYAKDDTGTEFLLGSATGGTGLNLEEVQDAVAAMLGGSTQVVFTYDDIAGTLTATLASPPLTEEQVQDIMGSFMADSASIDFVYNDAGNTLTANITASGVTAGAYGSASQVPVVTVGADGRVTAITTAAVSGGLDTEAVQDVVGSLIVGSNDTQPTYDDAQNRLTIDLKTTGVTAGTYGSATQVPVFTVDNKGRISGVTNTTVAGGGGGLDLEGVQDAVGAMLTDSAEIDFSYDDAAGTATAVLKTSGVTAGTYGSTTQIPVVVVDSKGRITGVTTAAFSAGLDLEAVQDAVAAMFQGMSSSDTAFSYNDATGKMNVTLGTTGVTAKQWGSVTKYPVLTVDWQGRITAATEYDLPTGSGTVTSVNASGGATGLSFSGGPITGSGTLTLAGTLGFANGGTGGASRQAGLDGLTDAGNAISGQVMRYNGTNAVFSSLVPAAGIVKSDGLNGTLSAAVAGTDYPTVASVTAAQSAANAAQSSADYANQHRGFKNLIINPRLAINQRNVANWAAVANGAYGYDCWKKVDASNITQVIEAGSYRPNTVYTLSGTNVTTQQVTSPASGNWTLPAIPITANNVQLEEGNIATLLEIRPIGVEATLCKRYFETSYKGVPPASGAQLNAGEFRGVAVSASDFYCFGKVQFEVAKASFTPTIQSWSPVSAVAGVFVNINSLADTGNVGVRNITHRGFEFSCANSQFTGNAVFAAHWVAKVEL